MCESLQILNGCTDAVTVHHAPKVTFFIHQSPKGSVCFMQITYYKREQNICIFNAMKMHSVFYAGKEFCALKNPQGLHLLNPALQCCDLSHYCLWEQTKGLKSPAHTTHKSLKHWTQTETQTEPKNYGYKTAIYC